VFEKQDSLGLKSWSSFALDAGIQDTVMFARCAGDTVELPLVVRGRALGERIGVRGTPTILINGWRMPAPPYDSLADIIKRVVDGSPPFVREGGPKL
jgi:protein-disulfide isomerase